MGVHGSLNEGQKEQLLTSLLAKSYLPIHYCALLYFNVRHVHDADMCSRYTEYICNVEDHICSQYAVDRYVNSG